MSFEVFDDLGNFVGTFTPANGQSGAGCGCVLFWPFILIGILVWIFIVLPISGLVHLFRGELSQTLSTWFKSAIGIAIVFTIYSFFHNRAVAQENSVAVQSTQSAQWQEDYESDKDDMVKNPPLKVKAYFGHCVDDPKIANDCGYGAEPNYLVLEIEGEWQHPVTISNTLTYSHNIVDNRYYFDPIFLTVNNGEKYTVSGADMDSTKPTPSKVCLLLETRTLHDVFVSDLKVCYDIKREP